MRVNFSNLDFFFWSVFGPSKSTSDISVPLYADKCAV